MRLLWDLQMFFLQPKLTHYKEAESSLEIFNSPIVLQTNYFRINSSECMFIFAKQSLSPTFKTILGFIK